MATKKVYRRLAAAKEVESAARSFAGKVSAGLTRWLGPEVRPGEPPPDFTYLFRLLERALARRREALDAADLAILAGRTEDAEALQRRDAAAATVREALLDLRRRYKYSWWKKPEYEVIREPGRLPESPEALHQHGTKALWRLRTFGHQPQPPEVGKPWDVPGFIDRLERELDALEATLDDTVDRRIKANGRVAHRERVQADFEATLRRVIQLIEAHTEAADLGKVTGSVRPPDLRRHRGRARRRKPKVSFPLGEG